MSSKLELYSNEINDVIDAGRDIGSDASLQSHQGVAFFRGLVDDMLGKRVRTDIGMIGSLRHTIVVQGIARDKIGGLLQKAVKKYRSSNPLQ